MKKNLFPTGGQIRIAIQEVSISVSKSTQSRVDRGDFTRVNIDGARLADLLAFPVKADLASLHHCVLLRFWR